MIEDPRHDEEHAHHRFSVKLMIRHPSFDPDAITEKLKMEPSVTHRAGAQRKTPKGTVLEGTYRESLWSVSIEFRGSRFFFEAFEPLIERLEGQADFVRQLTSNGGRIFLIVNLFGDNNIGDVLSWEALERLAKLKVSLGVEVF